MSHQRVAILSPANALWLGRNAKIVAIRWDLVPWCLVLDLDTPVEEDVKNAPVGRAWLVFIGVDEISWSVEAARLPNGIFGTDVLRESRDVDGFRRYELPVLAPVFSSDGELRNNPHSMIIITAKGLLGATSIAASQFEEFGPDRQQRDSLASEEDFLEAIGDVWKTQ